MLGVVVAGEGAVAGTGVLAGAGVGVAAIGGEVVLGFGVDVLVLGFATGVGLEWCTN